MKQIRWRIKQIEENTNVLILKSHEKYQEHLQKVQKQWEEHKRIKKIELESKKMFCKIL